MTLHTWFPIISTTDLLARASQAFYNIEDMILILSVYLHADHADSTSRSGTSLSSVYDLVKEEWSRFQAAHDCSVILIQAGLLIAIYEDGQLLEDISRATIITCARMGFSLGLQNSLHSNIKAGSSGHDLEIHRRVWWGIIILERY